MRKFTRTVIGVAVVGALASASASLTGPAAHADEPVPLPIPGEVLAPRTDQEWIVNATGGWYEVVAPVGTIGYVAIRSAQSGAVQAPVCGQGHESIRVFYLESGSYILGSSFKTTPPTTGDRFSIASTDMSGYTMAQLQPHDFRVQEEEGALLAEWSPPVAWPRTDCSPLGEHAQLRVYRQGHRVQTLSPLVGKGSAFVDPLTVGVRYGLRFVSDYLGQESTLVAYGTPRIPSVLLFGAPSRVTQGDPFPIDIALEDRKGRPLAGEDVALYFEGAAGATSASQAPAKGQLLKKLKTNRAGQAKTTIKLKRSGRVVAVFKARGKHGAVQKVKKIRVGR